MSIILGTAQLGLNYGITNINGKPSIEESLNIIDYCVQNNILIFDTARAYGTAEEIVGEANKTHINMKIITKLDSLNNLSSLSSNDKIIMEVENSIKSSLKNLGTKKLDTLLLHRYNHYTDYNRIIWNHLLKKKEENIIGKLGVSIYNVNEAIKLLRDKNVKHIQLPMNLLDRQWDNNTFIDLIKTRTDITFHCRSIFLQGILISTEDKWPKLDGINPTVYIENLEKLAKMFNLHNRKELCISYVKSIGWVNGIIIGVDSINQLEENIKLFTIRKLTNNELHIIKTTFANIPKILLNPSNW